MENYTSTYNLRLDGMGNSLEERRLELIFPPAADQCHGSLEMCSRRTAFILHRIEFLCECQPPPSNQE